MLSAQLLSLASQLLGVTITATRSNLSGLNSITLEGLTVAYDKQILLSARRLTARLSLSALLKGELHFSEVIVEGALLSLERSKEGKWNRPGAESPTQSPSRIRHEDLSHSKQPDKSSSTAGEGSSTPPSRLQIESLEVLDSSATVLDHELSARAELHQLSLTLSGLRAHTEASFESSCDFSVFQDPLKYMDSVAKVQSIRSLSAGIRLSGSLQCGFSLSPSQVHAGISILDLHYKDRQRSVSEPQCLCTMDAIRNKERWTLDKGVIENKAGSFHIEARLSEIESQTDVLLLSALFKNFDTSPFGLPIAAGLLSGKFTWETTFNKMVHPSDL